MSDFANENSWCNLKFAGATSSRDRSDSFTLSRTRTNSDSTSNTSTPIPHQNGNINYNNNIMPPPKKIPGRPCSTIFSQRNSPPNNSSPLSPPSASYSTESDGSSISIDEPDFPQHMTPEDHIYKWVSRAEHKLKLKITQPPSTF